MKRILIKLSGEIFAHDNHDHHERHFGYHSAAISTFLQDLKELHKQCLVSLVIGGGNLFRGGTDSKQLGIRPITGHSVGMVATLMNGLILRDLLHAIDVPTTLINSFPCPSLAHTMNQEIIDEALATQRCIIFTGGTGNPYVTTDTASVVRALHIQADELWKATKVEGVFDKDPTQNRQALLLKSLTHQEVLTKNLAIMDIPAIALARDHNLTIRVFNIFSPHALMKAFQNKDFGSTISSLSTYHIKT